MSPSVTLLMIMTAILRVRPRSRVGTYTDMLARLPARRRMMDRVERLVELQVLMRSRQGFLQRRPTWPMRGTDQIVTCPHALVRSLSCPRLGEWPVVDPLWVQTTLPLVRTVTLSSRMTLRSMPW